tara:strand:- start:200 stop:874 length:675 start_codon:yes stop_codon:yes gene_type:complete
MAVSGTYNFNLDIDEVIQEALEMIGGEQTLGHEPASARRSINLMLKDWQNMGVLLWSTSVSSVTVVASTTSYSLDSSTIDALEVVLNRDDTDLQLTRITPEEYLLIPNKKQTGRPSQYSLRRGVNNPTLSVWPLPENSTDVLKIEIVSELQDIDKSAIQNADIHKSFLPCLTTGLAYSMSLKRPGVDLTRIQLLKSNYEEILSRALLANRETALMKVLPRLRYV